MYNFTRSTRFKKDIKLCLKQGKDILKFKKVHELLIMRKPLSLKYRDHSIVGKWNGYRDCHLEPDWVLIYRVDSKERLIEYARIGSHSELFD